MVVTSLKVCRRCGENAVRHRNAYCCPCHAEIHEASQEADRQRARAHKQRLARERDEILQLGRAARAAGLSIADIDAMTVRMSPEEERLMSHG
jgi:hypothetical protein